MTGDHARAAEVGIDHVLSEVRPDEKAAAIERLRAQGKTVCMVGDGINDTPALGVLHPSICATAMSASSIGVLMHSLRLKDSGKKESRFPWKKKS